MGEYPEQYVRQPGRDFTCPRTLAFETVISLLLTMSENSIGKLLIGRFHNSEQTPSASALRTSQSLCKPPIVYIALGVNLDRRKDVLGMWVSENESAKFWATVLNSAGTDNLTGFDAAIHATFPQTEIQNCIIHQLRNSSKYVSYKDRKALMADRKAVYAAVDEQAALDALVAFEERWDKKYPKISQSWRANWAKLSTCFKYPQEVRRLIYTTNTIEGFHRQLRNVTKAKLVFPTDDSLLKMLYLAMTEITKKWTGRRQDGSMIHAQLAIFVHGVVDADAPLFSVKKARSCNRAFSGDVDFCHRVLLFSVTAQLFCGFIRFFISAPQRPSTILSQSDDLFNGQGAQRCLGLAAQAVLGVDGLHDGGAQTGGDNDSHDLPFFGQVDLVSLLQLFAARETSPDDGPAPGAVGLGGGHNVVGAAPGAHDQNQAVFGPFHGFFLLFP